MAGPRTASSAPVGHLDGLRGRLFLGVSATPRDAVLSAMLALGLLATPISSLAQQPAGKPHRVGVLCPVTCAVPPIQALRQGLLERGYVEGRTIVFEYRPAEGKFDRYPELTAQLVARQVDVIVAAGGLPAVLGARRATATVPIVFVALGEDPVQYGLVQSLGRPGGNVTGLVGLYADLVEKQLELLTEIVPGVSRVAALWDIGVEKALEPSFKSLQAAAKALGVQSHPVAVHGSEDFTRALHAAADARVGAVIILPSPTFFVGRARLANLAAEHRLPAISPFVEYAQAGGLIAYGSNVTRMFSYAVGLVDRILKGTKPADMPVEQPTEFILAINLKTAKALGLTMPPSVLLQATEVIR